MSYFQSDATLSLDGEQLAEDLIKQSDEVFLHMSNETLKAAEGITLQDLLDCPATRCECVSLIHSINRFKRYYTVGGTRCLSDEEEQEAEWFSLLDDIQDLGDSMNRKSILPAFDLLKEIKARTSNGRAVVRLTRKAPSAIAASYQKPLTDEQLDDFLQLWINISRKEGKTSFSRAELLNWIQKAYLEDGKLQWHPTDVTEANREESWKSRTSALLQEYQSKEVLTFRTSKQLWYIYAD